MNMDELGGSGFSGMFDHNGHSARMYDHYVMALEEMKENARVYFPPAWVSSCSDMINSELKNPFQSSLRQSAHSFEGKKPLFQPGDGGSNVINKVAAKLASDTGLFVVAGPSGGAGGWGYISNYGLPSYALELIAPGASADFRRNFALDAFDRPTISAEGTKLVINDKNGRAVEVIDQATATPKQLEAFRERYLQLSSYKGGNWMIKTFIKEFGPAGGYVDFGVVGPTSSAAQGRMGSFPSSVIGDQIGPVSQRIRAQYIEKGLIPPHIAEDGPGSNLPSPFEQTPGRFQESNNQAMIDRGMLSPESGIDMSAPARMSESYYDAETSSTQSNEIQPQGAMAQPLAFGASGRSSSGTYIHAGLNDDKHVQGLVGMYFPRVRLDPAAAAAYIMRMTNPLNTIMVHTPLKRTKEMEIQFRRRVMEGIPLMQITGADVPGGEPISTNGVKRLAHMLKQREMLPKIKDNDERN